MRLLISSLNRRAAKFLLVSLILVAAAVQTTAPLHVINSEPVLAQGHSVTAIEGWATDALSRQPVADARIMLDSGATATSGRDGYFAFTVQQLGIASTAATGLVNISVEAQNHARWTISGATYYAGDVLRLYPQLEPVGQVPSVLKPLTHYSTGVIQKDTQDAGKWPAIRPLLKSGEVAPVQVGDEGANIHTNEASTLAFTGAPPATIRVYRTQTGAVEVVSFRDYLKHVLPSEWIPSWGAASLKAGAMAVKSYAWYWVSRGGKQAALGADVKDNTEDQVYDPNLSYASTDAAVDATYQYAITRYGALFQAQYCSGSYSPDPSGDCPWPGPYMTQWGTAYYSDNGRSWPWIMQFYYPDAVITPNPPGGSQSPPSAPATPRPAPTTAPPPVAPPASYAVGQGASNQQAFIDAYNRNGGILALGKATGSVRWWLQYVTDANVSVQPLAGADGKGNTWLVYDVLKSSTLGVQTAYLLRGEIAAAYANHTPSGPEWVGAPTSDAYVSTAGVASQGFASGTISVSQSVAQFAPWPDTFPNWKAEYFVGHQAANPTLAPLVSLPGQAAMVKDAASPSVSWTADAGSTKALGVGPADWSVQYSKDYQSDGSSMDFTLAANSGARLWVDGMLAINGWSWTAPQSAAYSADLTPGTHQIRVQYFSPDASAQLAFSMQPRKVAAPPAPATTGDGTAQLRVKVRWLGRALPPSDQWVQPLTLQLGTPGGNAIVGSYKGTTDKNGVAFFSGLPAGTYDVHVKGAHSLQSARAAIALTSNGTTDVDMKTQIEGDLNNDNCVTVDDLALVQAQLGMRRGMVDYDPNADLNNDGEVTVSDISLLRSGFDRCGDVSADGEARIMSADASVALSDSLAPWLAPEQLQHNLVMFLTTSAQSARVGQYVDVQVAGDTLQQTVDGAAFVLKYDPLVLAPIDLSVNPATGVTPALALPSVMGSWLDANNGAMGYSAGMVQGPLPQGKFVIAKVRFKVIGTSAGGRTQLSFLPAPSGLMQLTNGGTNLLARTRGLSLSVAP